MELWFCQLVCRGEKLRFSY